MVSTSATKELDIKGFLTSPAEFKQRVHFGFASSHCERGGNEISNRRRGLKWRPVACARMKPFWLARLELSTNLDFLLPARQASVLTPGIFWTAALRLNPLRVRVLEVREGGLVRLLGGVVVLAEEMGGVLVRRV